MQKWSLVSPFLPHCKKQLLWGGESPGTPLRNYTYASSPSDIVSIECAILWKGDIKNSGGVPVTAGCLSDVSLQAYLGSRFP